MVETRYLTVQDILWINTVVARSPQRFDFGRLEEATFYQYSYGKSFDVAAQAAKFYSGFVRLAPFAVLNEATGFVGFAAFLLINGRRLNLSRERALALASGGGSLSAEDVLAMSAEVAGHSAIEIEDAVAEVFETLSETVELLQKSAGSTA